MKYFLSIVLLATLAFSYPNPFAAEQCSPEICLIENGCQCSSKSSPIEQDQTPQFITLAFNDAVTDAIYGNYLEPLLIGRTNADGTQIGATFYVPHEYTDYERVNNLYNNNFEIAVHSISKNVLTSYWQLASEDLLVDEFYGQRMLVSQFANIPIEDIIGARTPNLAINGDTTFNAYKRSGIQYDNSWSALSKDHYFPYTLDFESSQPCQIGVCPTESFPGMWVLPMIDQVDSNSNECNALAGCSINAESPEDVKNWLMEQFERHYSSDRSPITFNVNSAFFIISEHNYLGFEMFLNELKNYNDAFLVSHKEVRDWSVNPVPLDEYVRTSSDNSASCSPQTCQLIKDDEHRYMRSCSSCPAVYPWVGNPLGEEEVTDEPTDAPTDAPTEAPTDAPTEAPTDAPTEAPTDAPTEAPTDAPTEAPTEEPTDAPALQPINPSIAPIETGCN